MPIELIQLMLHIDTSLNHSCKQKSVCCIIFVTWLCVQNMDHYPVIVYWGGEISHKGVDMVYNGGMNAMLFYPSSTYDL